jgi:hypothetical protein
MIDRKIKGVRFPPCILSNSKYVIPMTNMLPPDLAHFLIHAQHRRRKIASILCTKGGGSKSRRGKFSQFSTACITTVLIHLLLFYSSNSLFKSPLLFLSIVCEVRRLYFTSDHRAENKQSQQLPHQRAPTLVAAATIRFYRRFQVWKRRYPFFKCQEKKTRLFYKRGARREQRIAAAAP